MSMSNEEKLKIIIEAQNKAKAAFDQANKQIQSVEKSATSMGDKFHAAGKKMQSAGKMMTLGVTLPILAIGAAAAKSLIRIEQIGAQTDAVLKSTGNTANTTRKEIDALAGKLEELTGAEAESTTMGQNMLLTFTNIRNGVGKGNDIFNQATTAMLDMGTAMNGGVAPAGEQLKATAIQLGKALNDPIKGVTALSKVGVTFTSQQKEQIKTMVEAGNTMGAQKLILAELNKEFGGSAEAFGNTTAGKIAILKHRFGTMTEELMSRFLPTIIKVVEKVSGMFDAFTKLSAGQKKLITILIGVAAALGPVLFLVGKLMTLVGFVTAPMLLWVAAIVALGVAINHIVAKTIGWAKVITLLKDTFSVLIKGDFKSGMFGGMFKEDSKYIGVLFKIREAIISFARVTKRYIENWVLPGIQVLGQILGWLWVEVVQPTFKAIVSAIKWVVNWWSGLSDGVKKTIKIIVAVLAVLAAAFISPIAVAVAFGLALLSLWKKSETFRKVVTAVFNAIATTVKWAWENVIKPIWTAISWWITNVTIPVFQKLWPIVQTVFNAIATVVSWAWNNIIKPIWTGLVFYMTNFIIPAFQRIWSVVQTVWNAISSVLKWAWNTVIKPIWDLLYGYIKNTLIPTFQAIYDKVKGVFEKVVSVIKGAWDNVKRGFDTVKGWVTGLIDKFMGMKEKISTAFSTVGNAIKAPFKTAFNWIANGWNKTLGKLSFTIPSWVPKIGGKKFDMPDMPTLYKGARDFGGLAMVGDIRGQGGELINMPSGTDVFSNRESKQILRGLAEGKSYSDSGGTTNTFTGNIYLMNADAVKEFFKQLNMEGERIAMGIPA